MTIVDKWQHMMSSFADIKAAVIEKGGTISGGYNLYAGAVRRIYSSANADVYEYPEKIQNAAEYAAALVNWCKEIKEQIRLAIVDGGVECDEIVPLSEYGNRIRSISVNLKVITTILPSAEYGVPYSAQLEAYGGTAPYTWKYIGFGPAGLTVSEDGVIDFTPKSTGGYGSVVFTCTDSAGKTVEAEVLINVMPRKVHIELIGEDTFTYDGEPHTLNLRCVEVPGLELNVLYGSAYLKAPVEKGMYYATIVSKDNRYSIVHDKDYRLRIQ